MKKEPYYITAGKLVKLGRDAVPAEFLPHTHLIYSSPATLAFNSPGAQGFGVKRAGLAIPASVMLLVAPACCGRNTTALNEAGYRERFFYLLQDEKDIITGRHLRRIPEAVEKICMSLPEKPSVVMLCITCVDALLGTDMDRVCRKAEQQAGVPVRPCYMYALTRESRKPPMAAVRQTLYSLLQPAHKNPRAVNLLGYFSPLQEDCELYVLLRQMGLKEIREISRCKNYTEYLAMSQANFNLVLHPESRLAASDLEKRLQIPSIELPRLYQLDKLHTLYQILAKTLSSSIDDTVFYQAAQRTVQEFCTQYRELPIAIGSMLNANSFELALALTRYGLRVTEIYAAPVPEDFVYLRRLAELAPAIRIFTNLSPTMLYYDCAASPAALTIGQDAGYYHPSAANIPWNGERQPFGYAGVRQLFQEMLRQCREVSI